MGEKKITGEIVCEYLEKYPHLMKLTLARVIYKEHPEAFANIESVRKMIRYYTGMCGAADRSRLTDKRFLNYCQPITYKEVREDFILPATSKSNLIICDLHVPYHEPSAITASLQWGKEHQIDTVIIAGDFMDFYPLSSFMKDPRQRDLRDELDAGYEMMYYIANFLPKAKIYFLPGNHEFRLEKYLALKAPELLGAAADDLGLDFFLKFSDFGVTYLRNAQVIQAGKLFIGHGSEWRGGSGGVNPARTFALKSKANYLGGHFHRTSEHSEQSLDGNIHSCWSVGALCGLHYAYMPYNSHNLGFANVRVNGDHTFRVFNAKIFNGKVL